MKVLAFDFGASNGRAIVGEFDGKQLKMEVIHRFPNSPDERGGGLYWNFGRLFGEVKEALKKCGKIDAIGVDTWGVDFGLIDKEGNLICDPRNYRDEYSKPMVSVAAERVGKSTLYKKTGIQTMNFNTLFQLLAVNENDPELMAKTDKFLFMPDLFNYMLTGNMAAEYTVASTSEMINAEARDWDFEIIEKAGLRKDIFLPIKKTGEIVGTLKPEFGLGDVPVIAVGSHDTASAVAAVPFENYETESYISSGTWSLMGLELDHPVLTEVSEKFDVTNEGGVGGKIRYLKNIMGLWLVQQCKGQWEKEGEELSYDDITQLALNAAPHIAFIDPDNEMFTAPGDMPSRIKEFCKKTGQTVPNTKGEIIRVALESLAFKYKNTLEALEEITGRKIDTIHVIGGGSQNELLCRFAASASGRRVTAGPVEATAIGNMMVQLMALGEIKSLEQIREAVKVSTPIKTFMPEEDWSEIYPRFLEIEGK